jgi:iron-sulfur cluster assembly accessory protein
MSQTDNSTPMPVVTVTEQAASVIKAACASIEPPATIVHFSIMEQGDGVAHRMELRTETDPDDLISQQHDLTVAVSPEQVEVLKGAEVDFIGEGNAGKFVVTNPNISN